MNPEDRAPVEEIARLFAHDHFAAENGMRIVEARTGFARVEMPIEPRHLNAVGIVQGGAIFTLADLAFAIASNSHGVLAVGCQADVTWLKAVRSGTLAATAEEIHRSRTLSTCIMRVTDDHGELVALVKGMAYIKGTPLEAA